MTSTWPSRARWAMVAERSGFTEVATSGPDHSSTAGITRAEVLATRGPEHQDRVAVLGRQQPPEHPRGAAEDHPARLGSPTVSSRSSRPPAQTAPACLAGLAWLGR